MQYVYKDRCKFGLKRNFLSMTRTKHDHRIVTTRLQNGVDAGKVRYASTSFDSSTTGGSSVRRKGVGGMQDGRHTTLSRQNVAMAGDKAPLIGHMVLTLRFN